MQQVGVLVYCSLRYAQARLHWLCCRQVCCSEGVCILALGAHATLTPYVIRVRVLLLQLAALISMHWSSSTLPLYQVSLIIHCHANACPGPLINIYSYQGAKTETNCRYRWWWWCAQPQPQPEPGAH